MNQFLYFWLLFKASLFSTGGFGNMPSLHNDFLARGWADDRLFGESLAIGQVSPGPNGLWVISFGYLTDGVLGSVLALVAITLPPLLIIGLERLYRRVQHHPAVEGFVRGLGLAVVGIFFVVLFSMVGSVGLNVTSVAIAVGSVGLAMIKRMPVIVILGLGGLVGVIAR